MATITFDASHKKVLSVEAEDYEVVEIPEGVTTLGEYCFQCTYCSIVIPASLTSIEDYAFYWSSFASIVVKPGNKIYDSRNNCNAIIETATNTMIRGCENTIIPESVTSLGGDCFECCGIGSIDIPESVTSIECGCFYLSGITHLTIPDSVTYIGSCIEECEFLTSIVVKPGNKIYDSRDNCNAIIETATNRMIMTCKNSIIPEGVTSLDDSCFRFCRITSIVIPESLISLKKDNFMCCDSLTSIVVKPGNKVYDSRDNCNAIIETATNTMFRACHNTIIPEGVTSIGDYCFRWCSNLKKIVIPEGVTSIGGYCFAGCCNLTSIVIPEGVTSIGDHCFDGCSNLTSIVIPESVTSIGNDCFCGCSNLISIVIPEGVTSIGDCCFYGCSNLTSIVIPESITSIGDYCFYGCI